MKITSHSFRKSIGIALLVGVQACSSDGKKESRTADAMEQNGDAMSKDVKNAQVNAKEKIREVDEKLTEKSQDAAAGFRRDRDVVVANIKARSREINAKLDELHAKAKRNGNAAKDDSKDQIAKLRDERDDLKDDLRKAQSATADAWRDVKKGFKRAGDDLGDAFDKAGDKLKDN